MPADGPSLGDVARRPSVLLFLAANFILEIGITAQFTALGFWVFQLTRNATDLGFVGLAEFVPIAVLVLVAGALADRFRRNRVAAAALAGEAVFSLALTFLVRHGDVALATVLALVVGYATARAFLSPAIRSLGPTIVEPEALPRMNTLFIGTFQVGVIVGPVVGAFLYRVDEWVPFAAATGCYVVAAALMLLVRALPQPAPRPSEVPPARGLRDALEGLKVIRREPLLLGAISLDLFAVLFGGAVALLPVIASEQLDVGVSGLGWMRAAIGIGAAATTAFLAFRPVTRRVGPTLFIVVGIFGVATIVLGITHSFWIAIASLLIGSAADSVSVFIRSTLVPLVTPNQVRGRVSAVENVFIGASNELGQFESGIVGGALGAGPAIAVGGVVTIGVVLVWPVLFPEIRHLDRFPMPETGGGDPLAELASEATTSRAEGS